MAVTQDPNAEIFSLEEIPERLDEQHIATIKTFGFLIHPNIPHDGANLKIADVGTGTGIWLLDVANIVAPTCQLVGFDIATSSFPDPRTVPPNVSFQVQDMHQPFPASEIGTYDIIAVRFVSSATTRTAWSEVIANLMTLLKPGGWLQWIDSCNFSLYNSVPGTSRSACHEIYDGLESYRDKEDVVIGMMMREPKNVKRPDVFRKLGFIDVHEDVFSTDRLQDPKLELRDKGTRNALVCFVQALQSMVGAEGSAWTEEGLEHLKAEAMKEIDQGVYHTLDQVCIVGRKAM